MDGQSSKAIEEPGSAIGSCNISVSNDCECENTLQRLESNGFKRSGDSLFSGKDEDSISLQSVRSLSSKLVEMWEGSPDVLHGDSSAVSFFEQAGCFGEKDSCHVRNSVRIDFEGDLEDLYGKMDTLHLRENPPRVSEKAQRQIVSGREEMEEFGGLFGERDSLHHRKLLHTKIEEDLQEEHGEDPRSQAQTFRMHRNMELHVMSSNSQSSEEETIYSYGDDSDDDGTQYEWEQDGPSETLKGPRDSVISPLPALLSISPCAEARAA